MSYTNIMTKTITFQLDTKGGEDVLTNMVMPTIKQSAEAIAARATGMAGSLSSDPPSIDVSTSIGTIKRGTRAIALVKVDADGDAHKQYVGVVALRKSLDAGRV